MCVVAMAGFMRTSQWLVYGTFRFGRRGFEERKNKQELTADMTGKIAMVTGGNQGLCDGPSSFGVLPRDLRLGLVAVAVAQQCVLSASELLLPQGSGFTSASSCSRWVLLLFLAGVLDL